MDRKLRVAVVDRQPLVRLGVRHVLEAVACIAGEFDDLVKASAALPDIGADMVVTDIGTHELAGLQLGPALHQAMRSGACVVVVSCQAGPRIVAAALRAGARGYLHKATADADLVHALPLLRRGGTYVSHDLGNAAFTEDVDARLSPRESTVLDLMADGSSSKEIARCLGISVRTVESHRMSLRRKLEVDGQAGLVKHALVRRLGG
jgi:DNA-binding NarL/FixJ family response regulator